MNKIEMRDWVSSLEEIIDNKLKKWKKESKIENGRVVQVEWQFELTHIIIDIFWFDNEELIRLKYFSPTYDHHYTWHGLSNQTFNKIQDRIGNLAQMTMYPTLDMPPKNKND